MCTSSNSTFAWVGAILVNTGFVALVSWGASTLWPLGFVLSAAYTTFLFSLARWLKKRDNGGHNIEAERHGEDEIPTREASIEATVEEAPGAGQDYLSSQNGWHKASLPVNLLFGLGVVSLGVTGFLLPINLIDACTAYHPDGVPTYRWVTNLTELPSGIKNWAIYDDQFSSRANFAYVEDTKTTLFQGTQLDQANRSYKTSVWTMNADLPPQEHVRYSYPENFVAVSASVACFSSFSDGGYKSNGRAFCSNGTKIEASVATGPLYKSGDIGDFLPKEGLLWFKQFRETSAPGSLVYSLNPTDMTTRLYSHKIENSDGHGKSGSKKVCDPKVAIRKQAAALLIAAALPVIIASFFIWHSEQIPSMAVTSYGGLTAIFICAYHIVDPQGEGNTDWWFEIWFCLTGAIGLLLYTYFYLSERTKERERPPLSWGLVAAGLGFTFGACQLLDMDDDTLVDWILLNFIVFAPLLLLGMSSSNMFLVFLCGIGFLVDAARIANYVGDHVQGNAQAPISFLVFSLAGIAAGGIGYKLTMYQPLVQDFAHAAIKKIDAWLASGGRQGSVRDDEQEERTLLSSLEFSNDQPLERPVSSEADP